MNIDHTPQEINSNIHNCGTLAPWYPDRDYMEFWIDDPDYGDFILYDLFEISPESPYDTIEQLIESGSIAYTGRDFEGAPVFVLATMRRGGVE